MYLVTVTPEQYYGTSYHFAFKKKENAKKKFDELVERHQLDHDGCYRVAQRTTASLNHIDIVELDELWFED